MSVCRKRHFCDHNCKRVGQSGVGNPFYGKTHSIDVRLRLSEKAILETRDPSHPFLNQNVSGCNNPFFGRTHSEETRRSISITRTRKIATGDISSGPRGRHGQFVSSKAGVVRYESTYELIRMKSLDLDDSVVIWEKNHNIRIPYEWRGSRVYVPDFKITYLDQVIIEEIKGWEYPTKLESKMQALCLFCDRAGYRHRLLTFAQITQISYDVFGKSIADLRKEWLMK